MAKCAKCGTNVGCGCQLKEGLCSFCYDQVKKGAKKFKHALSKAFKLS